MILSNFPQKEIACYDTRAVFNVLISGVGQREVSIRSTNDLWRSVQSEKEKKKKKKRGERDVKTNRFLACGTRHERFLPSIGASVCSIHVIWIIIKSRYAFPSGDQIGTSISVCKTREHKKKTIL